MMWGSRKDSSRLSWRVAPLALALSAGVALAQQGAAQGKSKDDFEKPLARAQGGQGGSFSGMYFSQQDGSSRYELSIGNDGEMTAKVNGEEVPADRIKKSDGKVEIVDKNGKTIATFNVSVGKGARNAWGLGRSGGGRLFTQPAPEAPQMEWTPPKVMMGITMGEPGDELRKFLGLKDNEAVLVDRVVEGLPADKAGIRPQDVIVEFDGVSPISEGKIRDILKSKSAGDKLDAVVLRKGERKTIHLELQKYDQERLGNAVALDQDELPNVGKPKAITKLGPRIREQWDPEDFQKLQDDFNRAFKGLDGQVNVWGVDPDGKFKGFMVPQDNAKLDKLAEQLARLSQKLDELQAKVDKLDSRKP